MKKKSQSPYRSYAFLYWKFRNFLVCGFILVCASCITNDDQVAQQKITKNDTDVLNSSDSKKSTTNKKKNNKAIKQKKKKYNKSVPMRTISDIHYGSHERNILDFWKAESDKPTPLVFVIHGGGWRGGHKEAVSRFVNVAALLEAGISVVSINYRVMRDVEDAQPPVKIPLYDAARALQFVRSKATEWNIDKTRISASGGSAGACSSLWLAYHDDLANPMSKDPIERESTRLFSLALCVPQTTLDPKQMKEWTPNSHYGGHAFGKKTFDEFLNSREKILPWIAEYSPYALVNAGDPPACLFFDDTPAIGKEQKDPTHTVNFGIKLKERCEKFNVTCEVVYPGSLNTTYENTTDYLIASLKGSAGKSQK